MTDWEDLARQAARTISTRTGNDHHDVAVVLGSGWGGAAEEFPVTTDIAYEDLPGFSATAVAGHSGFLRSTTTTTTGTKVLFFSGRTHLYEGRGVEAVVHGVRTAAAAGCRTLVLTNGCGGLNPNWAPGTPVLISDHINMTGRTPLVGPTFIDMTDTYSPRLQAVARMVEPDLPSGVYLQFPGPQYETPAEVRMAATLGADLVGMSTALEAIAARASGLEILGLSLVTNAAAGMTGEALHHAEVLQAGRDAQSRLGGLLTGILERL